MLKITIELCPFGYEEGKRTLGSIFIGNDGTGTHEVGNYNVYVCKDGFAGKLPRKKDIWKRGRVEGFPRLTHKAYDLLYRALKGCLEKRNKEKVSHEQKI